MSQSDADVTEMVTTLILIADRLRPLMAEDGTVKTQIMRG
jgi:hypothetical protein